MNESAEKCSRGRGRRSSELPAKQSVLGTDARQQLTADPLAGHGFIFTKECSKHGQAARAVLEEPCCCSTLIRCWWRWGLSRHWCAKRNARACWAQPELKLQILKLTGMTSVPELGVGNPQQGLELDEL